MTLCLVKHVATGQILGVGPGASWWEPIYEHQERWTPPRIFKNERAAKNFIASWARGRVRKRQVGGPTPWEEYYEEIEIEDVGRKKTDLAVVPIKIIELRS